MKPKLVYLHIPKCAGGSHRRYLTKALGEDSVFWYGFNSDKTEFDAQETEAYPAIGGHRDIQFYPHDYNALYTAVLRDPVERAVSLFNYCINPPPSKIDSWREQQEREIESWRNKGVDSTSMRKSIEQCRELRRDISNAQCGYLSRHDATLSGVQETLKKENMVIGLMEKLDVFYTFFHRHLEFQVNNPVRANAGLAGYETEILREPGLKELIQEVNREDYALFDFVQNEHGGLLVDADNLSEITDELVDFTGESNFTVRNGRFRWGAVHLYSKGVIKVQADHTAAVELIIANYGKQRLNIADTSQGKCAVSWRVQDLDGNGIDNLYGVVQPKTVVKPGHKVVTRLNINLEGLAAVNIKPVILRLSLVADDAQIEQDFPLSSTWSIIYPD